MYETTRVLITVKTYPHPSLTHDEVVCVGGITEAGDWVRLYPVSYRYRPASEQFQKYQWIEVDLAPRGHNNDARKESRRPKLDSIKVIGKALPPGNWKQRRAIVDKLPVRTVNQLCALYDEDKTSLGIVRPTRILDLKVETDEREWKKEYEAVYKQMRLFGDPPKPLKKIPYKFSYVFECEDSDKPHNAMIQDWELGVLYLQEEDRLGSEEKAVQSVKKNFFEKMCAPDKDTRFFMGTIFPYNRWIVGGVFWPPKEKQPVLPL